MESLTEFAKHSRESLLASIEMLRVELTKLELAAASVDLSKAAPALRAVQAMAKASYRPDERGMTLYQPLYFLETMPQQIQKHALDLEKSLYEIVIQRALSEDR